MTPATALKIAYEAYARAFVRGNPTRIDNALSRVEELREEMAHLPLAAAAEAMPVQQTERRGRRSKVYLVHRGGELMQVMG
jgi:hypothetical protein